MLLKRLLATTTGAIVSKGAAILMRLLLALSAYALLVGIALLVPALVDTRLALIAGLLLVPDALAAALAATLTGLGRAALASWLDALSNLVGLAATLVVLLVWHAGVLALAWLAIALAIWALVLNGLATLYVWTGWLLSVRERLLASVHQIRLWRLMAPTATTPNYGHIICLFPQTHAGSHTRTPEPTISKDAEAFREEVAHRAFGQHFRRHLSAWKQALAAALPLGLGALAATLYFRVDTLFLSAARGGQAVAYYSAPYQIVESF